MQLKSACANLRGAWAKRRYEAHFLSKLSDADGENSKTDTWLDVAMDCGYLFPDGHKQIVTANRVVGAMPGKMIQDPKPFLLNRT